MKKNRKKKLPRYWLGTRMPASLGYLKAKDAGNVSYSTTPGEDFTPEANAARANILPSAINRLLLSTTPLLNMFLNTAKAVAPGAAAIGSTASAMTAANSIAAGGVGARLAAGGTADYMGSMFAGTPAATSSTGSAAGSAASTAGRAVLNTAGKAIGIAGGAYGLANMAMDFAHNKDHRNVANMWNTVNTNTYTTDKGNTYNTYSAPNLQAELDYASSQKTSKNINNTINAIGTGAAWGSLGGLLGTGIGAAAGALYGLGSWLFGFGDTYEDTVNEFKKTQDVAALKSLLSEASAKNKDVRQGFYERSNDGRVGAKCGKMPRYSKGKANAMVSNGETIGKFKDGNPGELEYAYVVPGKVTENTAFADTKKEHVENKAFVLSNNNMPGTDLSYSQYANITGDYTTPLIVQDMMNRNKYNLNGTLKAKCGKMPKYNLGKWGDYALSTLPHLGSVLTNLYQYNRVKNAEEYAPTITTEAPAAQNAINDMMSERIDPRQYLNRSMLNYNQAAWNARRTPGMGLGGRMVMLDSLNRARQAQDADTLMKIDEANRTQRNKAYEARINLDRFLAEQNTKNAWMQHHYRQQAHGQKETWLAQYLKNMNTNLTDAAADALKVGLFNRAQDYQDKLLGLYNQQLKLDALKAGIDLETGKPVEKQSAASKLAAETDRYMKLTNPFTPTSIYPQYSMYKAPALSYPYTYPHFKVNWQ